MRSVLTALGIIIGVAAVIAMTGFGNGAKAQVEAQIASLGENVILIFAGSFSPGGIRSGWGGAGTLKVDDARAIRREIPSVTIVSPEIRSFAQIAAGNQNWATTVLGESEDYFDLRKWPMESGASFMSQDIRSASKVVVIGKTVAHLLFGDDSPVGQILRVRNVPFVITGVLSSKGLSVMGSDQDDVIVMPYTSAMKRVTGATILRGINVQVERTDDLVLAQQEIISLLRQRHNIRSGREDDFTVRNQQEIAEMATATSKTLTLLLVAIASVSLVVGGIGIMNIMLVSVTERTREIGIRVAIGAHKKDILMQFLIEAVTLSSMGGTVGILLGVGMAKLPTLLASNPELVTTLLGADAAQLFAVMGSQPAVVSVTSIVLSFSFSAAVGIFFGFYPAWKAAQLDPIEALRFE